MPSTRWEFVKFLVPYAIAIAGFVLTMFLAVQRCEGNIATNERSIVRIREAVKTLRTRDDAESQDLATIKQLTIDQGKRIDETRTDVHDLDNDIKLLLQRSSK